MGKGVGNMVRLVSTLPAHIASHFDFTTTTFLDMFRGGAVNPYDDIVGECITKLLNSFVFIRVF